LGSRSYDLILSNPSNLYDDPEEFVYNFPAWNGWMPDMGPDFSYIKLTPHKAFKGSDAEIDLVNGILFNHNAGACTNNNI
jgi:hypothetical protein